MDSHPNEIRDALTQDGMASLTLSSNDLRTTKAAWVKNTSPSWRKRRMQRLQQARQISCWPTPRNTRRQWKLGWVRTCEVFWTVAKTKDLPAFQPQCWLFECGCVWVDLQLRSLNLMIAAVGNRRGKRWKWRFESLRSAYAPSCRETIHVCFYKIRIRLQFF